MSFAESLLAHMRRNNMDGFLERRAMRICADPSNPRHARILERWQRRCEAELTELGEVGIDWDNIDWLRVIQIVLSILMMFLMFAEPGPMEAGPDEMQWSPGDKIVEWVITSYAVPTIKAAVPGFPFMSDEALAAYILDRYKAGQQ